MDFVRGLFDLSFSTFVTTKVVRVLYGLYLLGVGLAFLIGMGGGLGAMASAATRGGSRVNAFGAASGYAELSGFGGGSGIGVFWGLVELLLTPVACAMALIYGRVVFECVIVFFRVAEHVREIDRKTAG